MVLWCMRASSVPEASSSCGVGGLKQPCRVDGLEGFAMLLGVRAVDQMDLQSSKVPCATANESWPGRTACLY